jgi:MFS family permease
VFPFFYGWVILAVSTLGIVMSVPGQTVGVSVFTDHLIEATGLTRLAIANAYLIGTVASGLALPYGGTLVDRFGARAIVVGASTGLALTLVFLAGADRLAVKIAAVTPAFDSRTISWLLLALGFAGLRFSGQGMLTMVSRTMLAHWFQRGRGLVAAVSGPFVSFSFSAAPLLFQLTIASLGWRQTWLALALLVGAGMSAIGWLFYRDSPEQCGLRMYGDSVAGAGSETVSRPAHEFTRREALRTSAFWVVSLGIAVQAMVGTGITFHITNIGSEAGLVANQAVAIFLPVAVFSTLVGFAVGYLIDRVAIRFLVMVMMLGQAGMFVGMTQIGDPVMRLVTAACWGLASGFYAPLTVAALPSFFGRRHLGAIQGAQMMVIVIASAFGPSLLAGLHEIFGSYRWGFYGLTALPALVLIWAPFTRDPHQNPI